MTGVQTCALPILALGVADAIREQTGLDARIKWPNDVVLNGKKICGILTEMSTEIDYINYVVTGAGINANQDEFPEDIKETATSLLLEGGRPVRRSELIAAVMRRYEEAYETFMETGDLSGLQERYNELLVNRGRAVRVLEPQGEYSAQAKGINSQGELIVSTPEGEEKHIFAGEVSVRGIYGYI